MHDRAGRQPTKDDEAETRALTRAPVSRAATADRAQHIVPVSPHFARTDPRADSHSTPIQQVHIPAATLALLRRSRHGAAAHPGPARANTVSALEPDSPLRLSGSGVSGFAGPRAEGALPAGTLGPLRRQVIDSAHDDEIFEVEIAKRRAEVTNMNLGGSKIKQDDPARKNIEGFFSDPSHRKGTRSYPVNGPSSGGGREHPGTTVLPTSPGVLVLGPGGGPALTEAEAGRAQSAESDQATGEKELQDYFDNAVQSNPVTLGPLLQPLLLRAKKEIAGLGESGVRKAQHGVTHQGEAGERVAKINRIVADFKSEAGNVLSQRAWEKTVKDRNEYFASKDNKEMAELALARAKDDLGRAGEIYAALYSALGFDKAAIERITSTSSEAGLLEVHKALPTPEWAGFVTAVTGDEALLAFAVAHGAELAAVPNAGAVIRVWQANPDKVTKEDAVTILAFGLVGGDSVAGAKAAKFIGTVPVPDIGVLTTVVGGMTSLHNIGLYVACGGDVLSTKEIRALEEAPKLEEVTSFYTKLSTTRAEAAAAWTSLKTNVTDAQKQVQIIKSVVKAEGVTRKLFDDLVNNWDALNDRETVDSKIVARALTAGVIKVRGKYYESKQYGKGAIYVYELTGQGRLHPEWHVHFAYQSKKWNITGAGWKNQDEKFGVGVKTFDNAPSLQGVMKDKPGWVSPK